MANSNANILVSKLAAADLSSYQYYAVYLSAAETVNICNGYANKPTGVLWDKPGAAGRGCLVCKGGETPVILGGSVAAGDKIMVNATGQFIKTITGWPSYGEMMEAGSANEIRQAFIYPGMAGATNLSP